MAWRSGAAPGSGRVAGTAAAARTRGRGGGRGRRTTGRGEHRQQADGGDVPRWARRGRVGGGHRAAQFEALVAVATPVLVDRHRRECTESHWVVGQQTATVGTVMD